uniref:Uncharacterized protein n=1 Tax=Candidatus Kentrum sp. LFY TaxID=2126342 RepID=A0A450V976_9GAMM|nr:MAG: hypothetical protein BECKLFY1418A_GA0070994_11427 [Candidatus Kentron sp. LFY]
MTNENDKIAMAFDPSRIASGDPIGVTIRDSTYWFSPDEVQSYFSILENKLRLSLLSNNDNINLTIKEDMVSITQNQLAKLCYLMKQLINTGIFKVLA